MESNIDFFSDFFNKEYFESSSNESPDSGIPFYHEEDINIHQMTSSPQYDTQQKPEPRSEIESRESESENLVPISQTPTSNYSGCVVGQFTPKLDQTKKIKKVELEEKRSKAKQRVQEKKGVDIAQIPQKFVPEGFETADPKTKEKMIRMMKNRIAAQQSREKKKNMQRTVEQELTYFKNECERLQNELNSAQTFIQELRNFIKVNLGIDYPINKPALTRGTPARGYMNTAFMVLGLVCIICFTSLDMSGLSNNSVTKISTKSGAVPYSFLPPNDDKRPNTDFSSQDTKENDPKTPHSPPNPNPKLIPDNKDDKNTKSGPKGKGKGGDMEAASTEPQIEDSILALRYITKDKLKDDVCNDISLLMDEAESKEFLFKIQCLSTEGCWNMMGMNLYFLCKN